MRVLRYMSDFTDGQLEPFQCGVCIFDHGDRRAEVWIERGPFDTPEEAMGRAEAEAINLYERQIPGQARLWDDGPFL